MLVSTLITITYKMTLLLDRQPIKTIFATFQGEKATFLSLFGGNWGAFQRHIQISRLSAKTAGCEPSAEFVARRNEVRE